MRDDRWIAQELFDALEFFAKLRVIAFQRARIAGGAFGLHMFRQILQRVRVDIRAGAFQLVRGPRQCRTIECRHGLGQFGQLPLAAGYEGDGQILRKRVIAAGDGLESGQLDRGPGKTRRRSEGLRRPKTTAAEVAEVLASFLARSRIW